MKQKGNAPGKPKRMLEKENERLKEENGRLEEENESLRLELAEAARLVLGGLQ